MGTIADKITYLGVTKSKIKDVANMTGANIDNNTTFRNYAQALYNGYINVLQDRDTLLDNMNKDTSTGTISGSANLPVYEYKASKLSTQTGTPTPDNPVEVNTVKGYRNLFQPTLQNDGTNIFYSKCDVILENDIFKCTCNEADWYFGNIVREGNNYSKGVGILIEVEEGVTYYFKLSNSSIVKNFITKYDSDKVSLGYNQYTNSTFSYTVESGVKYISLRFGLGSASIIGNVYETTVSITKGDYPYVPYGTNWIYTTITSGANSRIIPIPLNNNEICGIGDYKDELVIDKNGNAKLTKKIGKVVLDGTENWQYYNGIQYITSITNYKLTGLICLCSHYEGQDNVVGTGNVLNNHVTFRNEANNPNLYIKDTTFSDSATFKTWLGTHNVDLYYILATPTEIDLGTVDIELYSGTNNITNSENMDMSIIFIKDTYE